MNSRAKFWVVLSSTGLVAFLLLGAVVTRSVAADTNTGRNGVYPHIAVYSEVLSRIKSEYVAEPDMNGVSLGAVNGMLEALDPYASYLNATQFKEYIKNYDTYKGDLGMVLAKKFGYVTVVSVVPGSPADKAQLTTGDFIETIKGVGTRDMPLAYASLLLRGEPNSTIDLTVLRRKPEPQKLTMTRTVIAYPALESKMLADNVGYVKVSILTNGKVKELSTAVTALEKQGAKKLVIDLRNCATGDPEDGAELAGMFAGSGTLTYAEGQKFPKKTYTGDAAKVISKLPMVVLTNHGTAAAAEVGAAALQGTKRATLVGERTYGDASVRRPITMEDGSAIILSVAKYYTPEGKSIQDNGVTPDEAVAEVDANVTDSDDDGIPDVPVKKTSEDTILKKALEVLSKKTA
ncbi:MAG: carboxyl-terminal protease [Bryobacterales bacterium]|nr:carboxyl-terminal protease [Bryobacterales bacterium]